MITVFIHIYIYCWATSYQITACSYPVLIDKVKMSFSRFLCGFHHHVKVFFVVYLFI